MNDWEEAKKIALAKEKAAQEQERVLRQRRKDKRASLDTNKRAVVCFGRFNPPTTGHARLVQCLRQEAQARHAIPIVFPSVSVDGERNPVPFDEKVKILGQMFPGVAVSRNAKIRTPLEAVAVLARLGYTAVFFVVGSDRTQEFERIGRYIKSDGLTSGPHIILKEFGVITVPGTRNDRATGVASVSGTKLRALAVAGDYRAFARGVPSVNQKVVKSLYERIRSTHT